MVLLESLRSILSKNIKFTKIRAWSEKLWLLEVGASELFFCVFPTKIPAKPEMLLANRELHVTVGVALFLKFPNLRINSSWEDSGHEGGPSGGKSCQISNMLF